MKILIVDDDPISLKIAHAALGDYTTKSAHHAHEAISILEEEEFDVVLTDVVMPGPDGYELLRWIKKNHPEINVILLSGSRSDAEMSCMALMSGADTCLEKPFQKEDLLHQVQLLEKRAA